MPPRHRTVLLAVALAIVGLNTINALNKGGDAADFFEGGRRVLHEHAIYTGSSPASGFIGPPFQALFFAPFAAVAALDETAARLLWYGLNVLCLGGGVWCWTSAWHASLAQSQRSHLVDHWAPWAALLAILLPLQTNFEHQNMNPVLLAAIGAAVWALVKRRDNSAGALIGFAAALKVFPALLILFLATKRKWRPFAAAVGTASLLTALPLLVYGRQAFIEQLRQWLQVGTGGWPTRGANQSLIAAIDRLIPGEPAPVRAAANAPIEVMIFAAVAMIMVLAALPLIRGRVSETALVPELAAVTTFAVLLSPIAWDHYWVLLFPAFLMVYTGASRELLGRNALVVFWTAAVLTSGLSRVTLGRDGWAVARHFSTSTIAALLLYAVLLQLSRRLGANRQKSG
ncbi:MAG TPA: glycosyltransferase family 87 protein [Vicinamibacterales bacterium]|nr:glycosyltransferase family 87 protein [Vicinamibacterales bacterium]